MNTKIYVGIVSKDGGNAVEDYHDHQQEPKVCVKEDIEKQESPVSEGHVVPRRGTTHKGKGADEYGTIPGGHSMVG